MAGWLAQSSASREAQLNNPMKNNHPITLTLTAVMWAVTALDGLAASKGIVNVSASPHVKFRTIGLDEARWTGGFWGE